MADLVSKGQCRRSRYILRHCLRSGRHKYERERLPAAGSLSRLIKAVEGSDFDRADVIHMLARYRCSPSLRIACRHRPKAIALRGRSRFFTCLPGGKGPGQNPNRIPAQRMSRSVIEARNVAWTHRRDATTVNGHLAPAIMVRTARTGNCTARTMRLDRLARERESHAEDKRKHEQEHEAPINREFHRGLLPKGFEVRFLQQPRRVAHHQ